MLSEALLGVIAVAQAYQVWCIASRRRRARTASDRTFGRDDLAKVLASSSLVQGRNGMP